MLALVIDDSSFMRKVLGQMLGNLGFEVIEANNGFEGLTRLREMDRSAHLVMVDWNMPEMDGLDFVRAVRAEATFDRLPLIMVTTNNETQHIATALEAGANEYIMKPFTQDVVRDKLELLGLFSQ
jgi:two-component system, chemotaxis family, chemotaxis protein CheY